MVLQLDLPPFAPKRLLPRELAARKFDVHRFDGNILGSKGIELASNLAVQLRIRNSGLRYGVLIDEAGSIIGSPVTKINGDLQLNPFDCVPLDAHNGFRLTAGRLVNGSVRTRFEKSFATKEGSSKFTTSSKMAYDIVCDPEEDLHLVRFVYTRSVSTNVSVHLTHREPVEVFSSSLLISESELSFKASAVHCLREGAPRYNHTSIDTRSDEFVAHSVDGRFAPIVADMALLERDFQIFRNSLGLSTDVRLKVNRIKRDERGKKTVTDPDLNLTLLGKLFGLHSLTAPDKEMLLSAIMHAVVNSRSFDSRQFFASQ